MQFGFFKSRQRRGAASRPLRKRALGDLERLEDRALMATLVFERIGGVELGQVEVIEDRTAVFAVRLDAAPAAPLALEARRVFGDGSLSIVRGAALAFDADNWNRFQEIVVGAAPDANAIDGAATVRLSGAGVAARSFQVSVLDDDVDRESTVRILLDDFVRQPLADERAAGQEFAYINRLGGDRGEVFNPGGGEVNWGAGYVDARLLADNQFAGVFSSLNQLASEGRPLNLHALLPAPILPAHQLRATALAFEIESGQGEFKVELKSPGNQIRWSAATTLAGGRQTLRFDLPAAGLTDIQSLIWFIDGAAGNRVRVSRVEIEAQRPLARGALGGDVERFIDFYAPLLANFDEATGRTPDRSNYALGTFDNVSASGLQALAAAAAWRLGVISEASAVEIVEKTSNALLALPRMHGLLPHFTVGRDDPHIAPGSEYSSLDTIVAWLATYLARRSLGLVGSDIQAAFSQIDWYGPRGLILQNGAISHGYSASGERLAVGWDTFGGESFLSMLGFALSQPTSALPALPFSAPPTADGSGFNDELAWLFLPPLARDAWGNDWTAYRQSAATAQVGDTIYAAAPGPIFGASAAEQAEPWTVASNQIYQAFGLGGRFASRNDGAAFAGEPIAAPHYAAMISELAGQDAQIMLDFLAQRYMLTPLNAVESLYLDQDEAISPRWNALKGSWNLGLAALGMAKGILGDDYPPYAAAGGDPWIANARVRLDEPAAGEFPFTISGGKFLRDGQPVFVNIIGYSPLMPGQTVLSPLDEERLRDDLRRLRQIDSSGAPLVLRLYPQPTDAIPQRFPAWFYDELRASNLWAIRDVYFDGDFFAADAISKGKAAIDAVIREAEEAGGLDRIFAFEWGNEFIAPLPEARTPAEAASLKAFLQAMREHVKAEMANPGRERFSNWFTWGSLPSYDPLFSDGDGSIPVVLETADFLSFNTYSYFPEALRYHQAGSKTGTPFGGYLDALREALPANFPIVISENGLPGSETAGEGQGRLHPWGPVYRYGGLSDEQIAEGIAARYFDARLSEKIAGFAFFQMADEWWKSGAPSQHDDHPEEHFGAAGYQSRLGEYELRNKLPWDTVRELASLSFVSDDSLSIVADDASLPVGEATMLHVANLAAPPSAYRFQWRSSHGKVIGDGDSARFVAPTRALGPALATVVAVDLAGNARTASIVLQIEPSGAPAVELLTSGSGRASGVVSNVDLSLYEVAIYIQTDRLYQQPFLPSVNNPEMTKIWVGADGYFQTPVHNGQSGGVWGELVAFVYPRGAVAENTPPIGYEPAGTIASARRLTVNDADNDLLPDAWEQAHFGALAFDRYDDPDGDIAQNLEELLAGGNPIQPDNDRDGDALPDNWERHLLGTLAYAAADDPDADGLSNAEELVRAIDPARLAIDADADRLPDSWERRYYGDLSPAAGATIARSGLTNLDAYELSISPLAPFAWRNERSRFDIDDDRLVSNADALLLISELRTNGPRRLTVPLNGRPPYFFDASGDDYVSQLDAFQVISALRAARDRTLTATQDAAVSRLDQSSSAMAKTSASEMESPGSTSPPSSVPSTSMNFSLVGDVNTRAVRVLESTYHTSSTPASKYSLSLRVISRFVLPLEITSTAKFGTMLGIGGSFPLPRLALEMKETSGMRI